MVEHKENEHLPIDRRRLSVLKTASYAGFAAGTIALVCVMALLFFPGRLVNRYIKPRITEAFAEAYPAYSLHTGDMNYRVFKNRFDFDSVDVRALDGTFSGRMGSFSVSGIGWVHLLWGGSLTPSDFGNSVVDAQNVALIFPQEQYELRCGLLHVSVPDSVIALDALTLHPPGDDEQFPADGKFRKTRFRLVVSHAKAVGIAFLDLVHEKMDETRSGQLIKDKPYAGDSASLSTPNEIRLSGFTNAVVDAQDIVLKLPHDQYEARCGLLHVSVPDSEGILEALQYHPSHNDEQFFAGSKFRQSRFRLVVSHARMMGLACLELLQGKVYRARSVRIRDAFLDVLINKDKDFAKNTQSPPMPGELLSSMSGSLQVDSLSVINGRIKYGERFAVGGTPALITFDDMQVLVRGLANHGDDGAILDIRAAGMFMKDGTMNLHMSIPVQSPEFSLQYSGVVRNMDLKALNSFLETAEQMRIKEGYLEEATFEISVASGRARGTVRAEYTDLVLAAINKQTGSEQGFSDRVVSFIANSFKIRGSNELDDSGSMKIGKVKHKRKPNEFFFEFAWLALRSGVGDVAGF